MKKIISLFMRDHGIGDNPVRDEITPGAEWVVNGEGLATRKWDGTCCMVRDGLFYKRYEVKRGNKPPEGFEPACEVDPVTGKQQGWLMVGDGPEDRWHREAWGSSAGLYDGTYELVGPKIQGNPDQARTHMLIPHGRFILHDCPRDFAGLKAYLAVIDIEGIVWHHPDGRMVKIKAKDFGQKRGSESGIREKCMI